MAINRLVGQFDGKLSTPTQGHEPQYKKSSTFDVMQPCRIVLSPVGEIRPRVIHKNKKIEKRRVLPKPYIPWPWSRTQQPAESTLWEAPIRRDESRFAA